jgi:DNA helicase II / ATP-dependent DNA helicase PcrA
MTDPLRQPGFLTEHQLRAVHPERDIFLTACPGSGKTRAAGVRVARLDDEGRRVAACSYTNVGVEQLRRVINVDLQYTLDSRQFVGTLHAFLLRYALYPFGHLATGSAKTPRLFGEDFNWRAVTFNDNPGIRLPIDAFHFRPDGSLCVRSTPPKFPLSPEKAVEQGQTEALRLKRQAARAGMVSFDDAMYWALKVLEHHPALAACVASRFDELLVDEAQDTSELQLACLTALIDTGKLDSLVLVGDLEQSISAYTGASRSGCEALAQTRGLTDVGFTQNHRSSQRICNVAFTSARATPPTRLSARTPSGPGPRRSCSTTPTILGPRSSGSGNA